MKKELVQTLTDTFEGHAQQTESGVEYWLARDIQHLLGYAEWRNFGQVISKAKTACEVSGHLAKDHFVDVNKTIAMPKGASKDVPDIMLTRYACYLIAQNGDPRKVEIAFAQTCFAVQTRKAELFEQRMLEAERLQARAQTHRHRKRTLASHLRANRRQPRLCTHPQQRRPRPIWQKHPSHESPIESARHPPTGRLCTHHLVKGQRLRGRNHHLQRPPAPDGP